MCSSFYLRGTESEREQALVYVLVESVTSVLDTIGATMMHVCVYAWGREKESKRASERDSQTDKQPDRQSGGGGGGAPVCMLDKQGVRSFTHTHTHTHTHTCILLLPPQHH